MGNVRGWGGPCRRGGGERSLCVAAGREQRLLTEEAPACPRKGERAPTWCLTLEFLENHPSTIQRNFLFEAGGKINK